MLQKTFSEGVLLESTGPQTTTSYKSTFHVDNERSYLTSINFVPKLIQKRTYLSINGTSEEVEAVATKAIATYNRSCSMTNGSVKSYESAVAIEQQVQTEQTNGIGVADGVKCFQNIELVPGLVMKDYSESINIFPKTNNKLYESNVSFDENFVKRNYVVGLEVQKFRHVELSITESEDSFVTSMHIAPQKVTNGAFNMNGESEDLL